MGAAVGAPLPLGHGHVRRRHRPGRCASTRVATRVARLAPRPALSMGKPDMRRRGPRRTFGHAPVAARTATAADAQPTLRLGWHQRVLRRRPCRAPGRVAVDARAAALGAARGAVPLGRAPLLHGRSARAPSAAPVGGRCVGCAGRPGVQCTTVRVRVRCRYDQTVRCLCARMAGCNGGCPGLPGRQGPTNRKHDGNPPSWLVGAHSECHSSLTS